MQKKRTAGLVADDLRKLSLEASINDVRTGCLSRGYMLDFGPGMISKEDRE